MENSNYKYLFFVTKPYSFSILEPIQQAINELNYGVVKWFSASSATNYSCPGEQLKSNEEVLDYSPDAVIVPGNVVPHFWPGLKVQIFHGLDEEVKGFYNITGFFDLYCTTGPVMTEKFAGAPMKWNGIQTCFDITLFVILAAREICPRLVVILTISPSFIPVSSASLCDISTNG